jgi:c-di-AMP phosphodiesterase-like protein
MKDYLFNPNYIPFWTADNSICAAISAIALIATLFVIVYYSNKTARLTSEAMRDTIKNFNKDLETSHYTELDDMYFELLKLALENPHLTAPDTLTEAKQRQQYDIYAYMVWNFIETIVDRCKGKGELEATWYPVIDAENRLHRKWFDEERNKHKFKDAFREFIKHENYKHWIVASV